MTAGKHNGVLVAHPGTQHAGRLAIELQRHGRLGRFTTGLAITEDGWGGRLERLAPSDWRRRWANRRVGGVSAARVHNFPTLELRALLRVRRGESLETVYYDRNIEFQRSIPDQWIGGASHVVGFDTSSWVLAERAHRLGTPFILDQTTGHQRAKERIFGEVRDRYPAWSEHFGSKAAPLLKLEDAEHAAAMKIVTASKFCRQTLVEQGVSAEKITIIPYGVDANRFQPGSGAARHLRPLRFLFVGLVNARKGVPLLLEAWREVARTGAELWIVGSVTDPVRALLPEMPGLRILGRRQHADLPEIFAACDVFVFPSFFEGFGLVLLEAMAAGLPVITTAATAAPDLITEGREGFVVTVGDLPSLTERMLWFASARDRAVELGAAARRLAERYSWGAYGQHWMTLLGKTTVAAASLKTPWDHLPSQ